jgi:ribosomal protein S18 acetylase RimI-like enzyme
MNKLTIRMAEKKDIPDILRLLVQVNNVHADIRPDLFIKDKTKYDKESLEKILVNKNTPVLAAVDEEGLAGYLFGEFQLHRGENNFHDMTTLYIDDLCVDERRRKQGVGRALYEAALELAQKNDCYNVTLNVWEGNDPARDFYEAQGMRTLKTCMETVLGEKN